MAMCVFVIVCLNVLIKLLLYLFDRILFVLNANGKFLDNFVSVSELNVTVYSLSLFFS